MRYAMFIGREKELEKVLIYYFLNSIMRVDSKETLYARTIILRH